MGESADVGQPRATLEREGRVMGSSDMVIAAHGRALGSILLANHHAFERIRRLKTKDRAKQDTN